VTATRRQVITWAIAVTIGAGVGATVVTTTGIVDNPRPPALSEAVRHG
jgi:hypothetical protein